MTAAIRDPREDPRAGDNLTKTYPQGKFLREVKRVHKTPSGQIHVNFYVGLRRHTTSTLALSKWRASVKDWDVVC